ncbi:MAG: Ppx-GppA domain-containing protein [Burkholderia sp.]|jgi:exopolyphosphatase / guanosine-5'-triphosphate,3'-diphosphate pyrophosphatase
MLLGAVDLGSNSFRVEIGRVVGDRIITQSSFKETVRLAGGFDAAGALTPEIQEKALACLTRFRERLAGLPASQVRAVGTQAMRIATNSEEFLKKAEAALGYPIEILSGHEEARMVFSGCAATLPPSDKRRLIVDIGGASTEAVIGRGHTAQKYESFHVGCVNTSINFFPGGALSPSRLEKAIVACSAEFEDSAAKFTPDTYDEAFGSAGTFGAVSEICAQLGWSDGTVRPEHLAQLREMLLKFKNVEHIRMEGLKPERREVIAGGLAVLSAVFSTFGIKEMRPAEGALRVGLLYSLLDVAQDRDPRDVTVDALLRETAVDRAQAERVASMSLVLLRRLSPKSSQERFKYLRWAALLHEIGMLISTSHYHHHSHYIIANADMPGFSSTDQKRMAALVLAQRGGLGKISEMLADPAKTEEVLALRLAVILCHARRDIELPDLNVNRDSRGVTIYMDRAWLDAHPLTAYLLEQECESWRKTGRGVFVEGF